MVYIRLILTLLFASAVSDLALSTSTSDTISFLLLNYGKEIFVTLGAYTVMK